MLEVYHPPIDKLKTRETRLGRIFKDIREQEIVVDKISSFLNKHRFDLGQRRIYLRADMLVAGILPVASKLLEVFSFDEEVYKKPLDHLISLLEKMSAKELAAKWQKFISEAEACLTNAPKTEKTEVAGWLIGPKMNPFGADRNFLNSEKETGSKFRSTTPLVRHLAGWLTIEHGLRGQSLEVDQWLGSGENEVVIDEAVDQEQLKRIFGPRGAFRLFDLLPDSLRKVVNRIFVVGDLEDEEITSSEEVTEPQEDSEIKTSLNLEDEEEATKVDVEKISAIKLIGQLDKDTRTMVLVVNETSSADEIINTWFHELGHAMIAGNSLTDQNVRRRFLKAVVAAKNLPRGYVGDSYETIGIDRGLEEDFAESMRNYCLFPREFQQNEPERFTTIKEILAEHFPDFDLAILQKKVYGFLKDADSRKKPAMKDGTGI
jgi:hypothetical protein